MKSARRKAKGIVVSTEMILLITALIVFAILAFYGLSKTIIQQAQSGKQTVVITRAEATVMEEGCGGGKPAILSASLYVKNTGNEKVKITHILARVKTSDGKSFTEKWELTGVELQPGETKVISRVFKIDGGCVKPADPAFPAYVAVVVNENNEVGTTVRALSPP